MNNSRERIEFVSIEAPFNLIAVIITQNEEVVMFCKLIVTSVCAFILTTGSSFGQSTQQQQALPEWLQGSTANLSFDGYYLWNFNRPLGRVNLLRAYDVLANSFTISQAGVIIEKPVNIEKDQRWGYRLDLMFGEATATLQGGAQNEPR